ncbi:MAG: ABC transporter permease subunit [Candidatus Thiodiazotropha sp.]
MTQVINKILGIIAVIAVWEILYIFGRSPTYEPSEFFRSMIILPGMVTNEIFLSSLLYTLARVIIIVIIALSIGTVIAIFVHCCKRSAPSISVFIDFFRSIPVVLTYYLFFPVAIDNKTYLLGIFLGFAHAIVMMAALGEVDKRFKYMSRALRISGGIYWRRVLLPACVPSMFSSLRVLASWSLVLVIVFEMFLSDYKGIGSLIYDYRELPGDTELGAAIIVVGLIGYFLNRILEFVEKKIQKRWA